MAHRRNFWRGLLTGGVIGALMTMMLAPQLRRPDTFRRISEGAHGVRMRAGRLLRRTRRRAMEETED